MMLPPTAPAGNTGADATRMLGGTGSVLDFAIGAEWL
jgi:hypothetical protein